MRACQDYALVGARVVSPHLQSGDRARWKKWASDVNDEGRSEAREGH